ncbi:MAG: Hsp20/alpha crystallin family protein [Deltaproteobacteria bacterium]|nr:Hsp20/alpha crystallin family protein [Deltaproteobacteria bacterium]
MDGNELQVKDKQEAEVRGEPTRRGPVFVPPVDIFENRDSLVLIADMPGVSGEGVDIHLKDNELTINGRIVDDPPESAPVYEEYETGSYLRRFTLSSAIDQSKIEASMKNGVLKVVLPKAEAAKPRQITVKAG